MKKLVTSFVLILVSTLSLQADPVVKIRVPERFRLLTD